MTDYTVEFVDDRIVIIVTVSTDCSTDDGIIGAASDWLSEQEGIDVSMYNEARIVDANG